MLNLLEIATILLYSNSDVSQNIILHICSAKHLSTIDFVLLQGVNECFDLQVWFLL